MCTPCIGAAVIAQLIGQCQQGWVGKRSPDPEHFSHFGLIQCVCCFYFSRVVVD